MVNWGKQDDSVTHYNFIEFGLVGARKKGGMHKVDESVPLSDLKKLTIIYQKILENYFK